MAFDLDFETEMERHAMQSKTLVVHWWNLPTTATECGLSASCVHVTNELRRVTCEACKDDAYLAAVAALGVRP